MRVIINGASGYMGRELYALIEKGTRGSVIAGGADPSGTDPGYSPFADDITRLDVPADVIIDFSHHSATKALTSYAVEKNISLVIATTGQTEDELSMIREASLSIPVFFASNYSMGVAVLTEMAAYAARMMPEAEIEIIEKHHNRKLDAPSGTALTIAERLRDERGEGEIITGRSGQGKRLPSDIGISSVRMGNIVGEHEIMIGTPNQTITLRHEAHTRALFAEGALAAAAFLITKGPGLYSMKEMVSL